MSDVGGPTWSRRDLVRAGGAGALLAALAACSSTADRGANGAATSSSSAATTLVPTTLEPLVRVPTAALVGDSISHAARDELRANLEAAGFQRVELDTKPGRRIADGDSPGLGVIDFAITSKLQPDVWIVELGTNDLGLYAGADAYGALIDLVLQRIPPPTPLVWVDTYSAFFLADSELFNAVLRDALARRGYAAVADWYAKCVEIGPGVAIPDGLHPSEETIPVFAEVAVAPIALVA